MFCTLTKPAVCILYSVKYILMTLMNFFFCDGQQSLRRRCTVSVQLAVGTLSVQLAVGTLSFIQSAQTTIRSILVSNSASVILNPASLCSTSHH